MSRALLKSTAVVSGMTQISRVLGLIRDVVFARVFGVEAATDAFFVAFRIPNFLRRLFAEGGFAPSFVPVLAEYRASGDQAALKRLIDEVFGTLGVFVMVITALGMLAAPLVVMVFAPKYYLEDPGNFALTTELLRTTFPYLFFISMTACAGGILNSYSRFAVPALTPVLLNLIMIAAALFAAPWFAEPVMALAWAVFVAGIVQLLFQIPFLMQLGFLPRPRWGWRSPGVKKILRLMLPTLFGTSVAQVNVLVNTILATFLATGSVSWLYYADRLMEFPQGLLGVALGTVLLPTLSREFAGGDTDGFSATLDWALRIGLILGLPAAVGIGVLAEPLMMTLFRYDAFTVNDAAQAGKALTAYSLGLLGFLGVKILAPGFFARQDTVTPVRIGILAVATNIVLSLLLVWPLAHAGLALATGMAACLNASLLYLTLHRRGTFVPQPGWGRFLLRVGLANAVMGTGLWAASGRLDTWAQLGVLDRVGWLTTLVVGGAAIYLTMLLATGLRPRHLLRRN